MKMVGDGMRTLTEQDGYAECQTHGEDWRNADEAPTSTRYSSRDILGVQYTYLVRAVAFKVILSSSLSSLASAL